MTAIKPPAPAQRSERDGHVLLEVEDLSLGFASRSGLFSRRRSVVQALSEVSFNVRQGETLGIVGESGCGKTTLGRCILRAHKPDSGKLRYFAEPDSEGVDLAQLSQKQLRPYRQQLRAVFQDPSSSLNPRMTVFQIIAEPLRPIAGTIPEGVAARVAETMELVGLRPEMLRRYPHAFSGGQKQRIGIARALVTRPRLVVADEAVSALDLSIRSQILNLMQDLQEEMGLTYIFVSHDLSVIEHLCDRIAVMYGGKIIETSDSASLFTQPRHPYTESLLAAVPARHPRLRHLNGRAGPIGEVPDLSALPPGCAYHPRCPYAIDACREGVPELQGPDDHHLNRCIRSNELQLNGIAGILDA